MTLKFYDSPFHATHDEETANKMAMRVNLSIMLTSLIKEKGWNQGEAAQQLGVTQSRISDLKNTKVENFTVDAMLEMLDTLGFKVRMSMPNLEEASISITKTQAVA